MADFGQADQQETKERSFGANDRSPGLFQRAKSAFTGEGRTEFPDAPEFLDAFIASGSAQYGGDAAAIQRSAITSDPAAQVDILRKNIPGLQVATDKFKNVMLKAPGMIDWAYLNKPGFSSRDIDEFFTPILATLPLLGSAGAGANLPARIATGGAFMGAAELERQGLEKLAGSEQQHGGGELTAATIAGGALAPGTFSSAVSGARQLWEQAKYPIWSIFSRRGPKALAERSVAQEFEKGVMTEEQEALRRAAQGVEEAGSGAEQQAPLGQALGPLGQTQTVPSQLTRRRLGQAMTPETARVEAANRLQGRASREGATFGEETRLMDIGGEPVRALARSAANKAPEARQTLTQVIDERYETQTARVQTFLESLLGRDNATATREQLEQIADSIVSPAYRAAMESGRRGVPTLAVQDMLQQSKVLQAALRRGIAEMQERAAAGRMETAIVGENEWFTLETWDQVKRALQDMEGQVLTRRRTSQAANIGNIRRELVRILDEAYPEYRRARGISERVFDANNALEAGEKFVTAKMQNDIARTAHRMMSPAEQELFRVGYISKFIAQIREPGTRENLLKLFKESPAALERLQIALGPDRAQELQTFITTERLMDRIRTAVEGNSTTTRQLIELGLGTAAGTVATYIDPHNWEMGIILGVLTKWGAGRAMTAYDRRIAVEIAQALTSRNPDIIRRGMQRLGDPKWLNILRRADRGLGGGARIATKPGQRVARSVAIQTTLDANRDKNKIQPLPDDRTQLIKGSWYQTKKGPAQYTGEPGKEFEGRMNLGNPPNKTNTQTEQPIPQTPPSTTEPPESSDPFDQEMMRRTIQDEGETAITGPR